MAWFSPRDSTAKVNRHSSLSVEEMEQIKAHSGFTQNEIILLEEKFDALNPQDGQITLGSFLRLPELCMPLSSRIPKALGISKLKNIDFMTFCKHLAIFHPKATAEDKLDFLFRLYDADGDGLVSKADLRSTLTIITGVSKPELINYTVDKVFGELVEEGESKLSKEDFAHGLSGVDISKLISLRLEED